MNENESSPIITIIAFIVIVVAIVAGAILLLMTMPEPVEIIINPPMPTMTPAPSSTPSPILVYVTGAVANPQETFTLPYASRVSDVIEAAGGFTENADLERVNLAGILHDGDQVHVPSVGEDSAEIVPTAAGGGIVYINTATLEELVVLPNIGPATAQRIIDYREANGRFNSLEDLDNVEGIGPATLEQLAELISFE